MGWVMALLALSEFRCPAVPVITRQPSPFTNSVSLGAFLTNSIAATTTNPPLTYQWQFNNAPLSGATEAVLILTNIQTTNGGSYSVVVSDGDGWISSSPWVVDVDPTFTKITSGPVVSVGGSTAACWGDFNNDGLLDLYVTTYTGAFNFLYTNNGDGTFTRITNGAVTTGNVNSFGCAWGDFDNDGWLDLFRGAYNGSSKLFHNNHDGTFTDVTAASIGALPQGGNNVVWGDYDNDGFLDLFQADQDLSPRCVLLHNNGNGTFTQVTGSPLTGLNGNCLGASWGDYNNDGRLDLVVSRYNSSTLFFKQGSNGQFTSIHNAVTVAPTGGGSYAGVSWGDYDNDGFLDLFISGVGGQRNALYHNNGDGTFTLITNSPIYRIAGDYNGGSWADYDNDGYLDLFVSGGSTSNTKSALFHNNGDGTFTQVQTGSPANDPGTAQGAAWGDYDNNGFPDLFVPNIFNVNNCLYRNNGNSNNWITVTCQGRISNRSSIGAKVRVEAVIRGKTMWQLREISGGGSLGSQNDLRCQFGLGDATHVEILRIEWPSGITQQFTNIAAKQFLTVKEPAKLKADLSPSSGSLHVTLTGGKGLVYTLESSTNLAAWCSLALLTNQTGTVIWTNPAPATNTTLFFRASE